MPNQKNQQFIEWFSIPHKHNSLYYINTALFRNTDPEIDFSDPEIDSLEIFPLLEANLNGNTFYLADWYKFFDWLRQLTFNEKISANRVLDLLLSKDAEGSTLLTKWHWVGVGEFLFALAYKGLIEYDKIFDAFIRIYRLNTTDHPNVAGFSFYAFQLARYAALDYNMGYSAVIELLKQKVERKRLFLPQTSIITVADLFIRGGKPWGFILSDRRHRRETLILVLNIMKQTNFEALSDFDFKLPIWDWDPMIITKALKTLGETDIQLHFLEAALDSKSEFHRFLGLNSTHKKCILLIVYLNEMRDDLLRSLKGNQTSFETFLLESSNSVYEQPSKSASLDPPKSLLDDDLGLSNDPCVALEPQTMTIANQNPSTDPAITPQMRAEYPFIYAMMRSVQTSANTASVPAEKSDLRLAVVTTNTEKSKKSFLVTVEEAEKIQPKVVKPVEIPAEKAPPLGSSFFGKTALTANNLDLPSVPQHVPSIPEPTLKTKVAIAN